MKLPVFVLKMTEGNFKINYFILCQPERACGLPGSYLGGAAVKPPSHFVSAF